MLKKFLQATCALALSASGATLIASAPAAAAPPSGFTAVVDAPAVTAAVPGGGSVRLACPTTGNCSMAVQTGYQLDFSTSPVSTSNTGTTFLTQVSGVWASATPVIPPAGFNVVAPMGLGCTSPGNCAMVGYAERIDPYARVAVSATQVSGAWGATTPLPLSAGVTAFSPQAFSCGAPGSCTVAGNATTTAGSVPAVADLREGSWSAVQVLGNLNGVAPAGTTAMLTKVSCSSANDCSVAGAANGSTAHVVFVAERSATGWGNLEALGNPDQPASVTGLMVADLACASPGNCTVAGTATDQSWNQVLVLAFAKQGTWTGLKAPETGGDVLSISPRKLACAVGGPCVLLASYRASDNSNHALLVAATDGTNWDIVPTNDPVIDGGQLDLASCNANGCLVAGHQLGSGMAKAMAFGVNLVGGQPTATASWDLDRPGNLVTSEATPACSADGGCSLVIANNFSIFPSVNAFATTTYTPVATPPAPSLQITAEPDPGSFGAAVTVTVAVKPANLRGRVDVKANGGRPIGHCYVSSGSCSFSTKALRAGENQVDATLSAQRPVGKVSGSQAVYVNSASTLLDNGGSDTNLSPSPLTGMRRAWVNGKVLSEARSCTRLRSLGIKIRSLSDNSTVYSRQLTTSVTGRFRARTVPLQPGSYEVMVNVDPVRNCEHGEVTYQLTIVSAPPPG